MLWDWRLVFLLWFDLLGLFLKLRDYLIASLLNLTRVLSSLLAFLVDELRITRRLAWSLPSITLERRSWTGEYWLFLH
jgi:hypothetical protein